MDHFISFMSPLWEVDKQLLAEVGELTNSSISSVGIHLKKSKFFPLQLT